MCSRTFSVVGCVILSETIPVFLITPMKKASLRHLPCLVPSKILRAVSETKYGIGICIIIMECLKWSRNGLQKDASLLVASS